MGCLESLCTPKSTALLSFLYQLPRQRDSLVASNMRAAMRESKLRRDFPNLMWLTREPGAARVFPYSIQFPANNTVETCLSRCSEYGYAAAGLEVCGHLFQYRAPILSGYSSPTNVGAGTLIWSPRTVAPRPPRPIVPWLARALLRTSAAVFSVSRKFYLFCSASTNR